MDLDLAICVPTREGFSTIIASLCEFPEIEQESSHRLQFKGRLPIDVIPFGGIEDADGQMPWPPDGDHRHALGVARESREVKLPIPKKSLSRMALT